MKSCPRNHFHRTLFKIVSSLRLGKRNHRCDIAFELDRNLTIDIVNNHRGNQATDGLQSRSAYRRIIECLGQCCHLATIDLAQIRMKADAGGGRGRQSHVQFRSSRFHSLQLLFEARCAKSIGDSIIKPIELARDLSAFAFNALSLGNLKCLTGVRLVRIGHLSGIDSTLRRYLERRTEDLPDHPDVFLSNVRGIVNQAFELIWKSEVPDKRIPSQWMAIWKRNEERRVDEWETTLPQGVHRVRLLNLITGTDRSTPCAKYVTKKTYVLINAVHAFGDFGQHQEGAPIDTGAAYSALHLCVELAAALTRELPNGERDRQVF